MIKKSLGSVDLTKPSLSLKGGAMVVVAVVLLFAAYETGRYLYAKLKGGVSRITPELGVDDIIPDFPT